MVGNQGEPKTSAQKNKQILLERPRAIFDS